MDTATEIKAKVNANWNKDRMKRFFFRQLVDKTYSKSHFDLKSVADFSRMIDL